MARSTASMAAALLMLACLLVPSVVQEANASVTCGQVASSLGQCINYLRGLGPLTTPCCNGVTALNSAARSTPDRQTACNCLKSLSGRIPNLQPRLAAGLPGQCGVSIPYPISTSTDCSRVR